MKNWIDRSKLTSSGMAGATTQTIDTGRNTAELVTTSEYRNLNPTLKISKLKFIDKFRNLNQTVKHGSYRVSQGVG